jgi:orotate phosphoribosyltransferase
VDRSGGALPDFGCPFVSIVQMDVETFDPADLPEDLKGTPAIKPGSK